MSLLTKARTAIYTQYSVNKIRDEHDRWAANATLDATYYTLDPTNQWRPNDPYCRLSHSTYVFAKRGSMLSAFPGQLVSSGFGAGGSWSIWYQHGPLTLQRQVTEANHRASDTAAEAGRLEQTNAMFHSIATEQLAALYPYSFSALVAA